MHKWFVEYMQSELERLLPDPYEEMCNMLGDRTPFSFSRFGDGEFGAIFGTEGANSEKQPYHRELGDRLRKIVEDSPGYMMGLQTYAVFVHGALPIRSLSSGMEWVLADALHNASMEGKLHSFFKALSGRPVTLCGGAHLGRLAEKKQWRFVNVAEGDCWPQYKTLRRTLESAALGEGAVFLLCASMTANVLIDDLFELNPLNTYIDAGSVFDPFVGIKSRVYHHALAKNPLDGIA